MDTNTLLDTKPLAKSKNKAHKVIFLRIPPALHAVLKTQARATGKSVNKIMTQKIEEIGAAATLRK